MTTPPPAAIPDSVANLGPGTLSIGETGGAIDVSSLINGAKIVASKDVTDPTTKLSGAIRQGVTTYTYELSGNMDIDIADPDGIFALSQSAAGTELPYTFTPNSAAGVIATGKLVLDPLDAGADAFGDPLASDYTFALTDKPTYTWPTVPAPDPVTV